MKEQIILGFTSALHLVTINDDVHRLIPKDSLLITLKKTGHMPEFDSIKE